MTRIWIEFPKHPFLPAGFGVTEEDIDEAKGFIRAWLIERFPTAKLTDEFWSTAIVTKDVDVSEMHSLGGLPLSHFCLPCNRGIWYPAVTIRADRF